MEVLSDADADLNATLGLRRRMRAVMIEPDHRVDMHSFQYRTYSCGSCGDTERRFVFDPTPRAEPTTLGPTGPESTLSAQAASDLGGVLSGEGETQSKMARIADALSVPLAKLFNK
jgi:hypothetical protein